MKTITTVPKFLYLMFVVSVFGIGSTGADFSDLAVTDVNITAAEWDNPQTSQASQTHQDEKPDYNKQEPTTLTVVEDTTPVTEASGSAELVDPDVTELEVPTAEDIQSPDEEAETTLSSTATTQNQDDKSPEQSQSTPSPLPSIPNP